MATTTVAPHSASVIAKTTFFISIAPPKLRLRLASIRARSGRFATTRFIFIFFFYDKDLNLLFLVFVISQNLVSKGCYHKHSTQHYTAQPFFHSFLHWEASPLCALLKGNHHSTVPASVSYEILQLNFSARQ